jgi:mRNA interferase MazF
MAIIKKPKRGDCWWVVLDPTRGSEIRKTRPCIIISIDYANKNLDRVTVVPLTSKVKPLFLSDTVVTIGNRQSKAVASQLRTVSLLRCISQIDTLSAQDMRAVEDVVKMHLGL